MRWFAALAVLVVPVTLSGCTSSARAACEQAVRKEYMDADKVFQQPADLNGFCATWNNHPPGIGTP